MNYKAPGGDSGTIWKKGKHIAREEFENAIRALQEQINVSPQTGLELAPINHKKKAGRRYKIASTIDTALYDRIRVVGLPVGASHGICLQTIV